MKELRRENLPGPRIFETEAFRQQLAEHHYADAEALLAAIGEHHVTGKTIAQRIGRAFHDGETDEQMPASVLRPSTMRRGRTTVGIHVEGIDDVLVRLSKCCTPVPGDEIMGFVTRGRGVSVHRADSANAVSLMTDQSARVIDVEWDGDASGQTYRAGVEVVALDRSHLLRDVANALSDHHVNIVACSTHTGNDRVAKMRFEFELGDPDYLEPVLRTIKQIDAVYDAYRLVPGQTS